MFVSGLLQFVYISKRARDIIYINYWCTRLVVVVTHARAVPSWR